jgi:hypothetical protein
VLKLSHEEIERIQKLYSSQQHALHESKSQQTQLHHQMREMELRFKSSTKPLAELSAMKQAMEAMQRELEFWKTQSPLMRVGGGGGGEEKSALVSGL